jgi:hypothetical protein
MSLSRTLHVGNGGSAMIWKPFNNGATIGTRGSEDGTIQLDDEHPLGARITLERDGKTAPIAITCGIYGWMLHTRFFSSEQEAVKDYESMKASLADILGIIPLADDPQADDKCKAVYEAIREFVDRFPC